MMLPLLTISPHNNNKRKIPFSVPLSLLQQLYVWWSAKRRYGMKIKSMPLKYTLIHKIHS